MVMTWRQDAAGFQERDVRVPCDRRTPTNRGTLLLHCILACSVCCFGFCRVVVLGSTVLCPVMLCCIDLWRDREMFKLN